MKCPRCQFLLTRCQVENVNFRRCDACHGKLFQLDRLNRLAATSRQSSEQLMETWHSYQPAPKTGNKVKCPECRYSMETCQQRFGVTFDHAYCNGCQMVWLDAGDLEIYLLAFQVSEKGKELQQFKKIHQSMPAEQKAELNRLIEKRPPDPDQQTTNPYGDPA